MSTELAGQTVNEVSDGAQFSLNILSLKAYSVCHDSLHLSLHKFILNLILLLSALFSTHLKLHDTTTLGE